MTNAWWRRMEFDKVEQKESRLLKKAVAWGLTMFIVFEIGLQIGMVEGRKMGRLEEKKATLEQYQQIVNGYREANK